MKKLFFVAAVGVAGLMSATPVGESIISKKEKKVFSIIKKYKMKTKKISYPNPGGNHNWITVETWCGKVFYLDGDDYGTIRDFDRDARYFTSQQCGGLNP